MPEILTSKIIEQMYQRESSWAVDIQISQISKDQLDPDSIWKDGKFMGIGEDK